MRLIDADALIRELNEKLGCRTDINKIICGMTVYEPEIVQPQWIPFTWRETTEEDGWDPEEFPLMACGELPENGQDILVTNGCFVWSDTFFDDNDLYLDSGNDLVEDVTAWMPLPEPYTPEGKDGNG